MPASTANDRLVSANVALALGLVSSVGFMTATSSSVAYAGIPIAALIGGWLAPGLRRPTPASWLRAVLLMAAGCTVLGAYGTVLVWSGDPLGAIGLTIFGVAVYGIPAFALLLIPAIAWASIITVWFSDAGAATGPSSGADDERQRVAVREPWLAFGLGIVGGFVAGLTLVSFAGVQLLGVIAVVGGIRVRPRPFGAAGLLLGTGLTWLILFVAASARCDPLSCQGPDLSPWFVAAILLLMGGVALLAIAILRPLRDQVEGSGTNGPSAVDTATNNGRP